MDKHELIKYNNVSYMLKGNKPAMNELASREISHEMLSLHQNRIKLHFKQRISQPGDIFQYSKAYQKNHLV
jgi:hypothetical protein